MDYSYPKYNAVLGAACTGSFYWLIVTAFGANPPTLGVLFAGASCIMMYESQLLTFEKKTLNFETLMWALFGVTVVWSMFLLFCHVVQVRILHIPLDYAPLSILWVFWILSVTCSFSKTKRMKRDPALSDVAQGKPET